MKHKGIGFLTNNFSLILVLLMFIGLSVPFWFVSGENITKRPNSDYAYGSLFIPGILDTTFGNGGVVTTNASLREGLAP